MGERARVRGVVFDLKTLTPTLSQRERALKAGVLNVYPASRQR